jgi:hypothetical protein
MLALACAGSLPAPEHVQQPTSAFEEVPYPPPAALVEVVPHRPDNRDAVWVDGNWVWRGRYYVWRRGGWLVPPPQASYATWHTYLARDGRLLFATGAWYDAAGHVLPTPEMLVEARTPPNEYTSERETPR